MKCRIQLLILTATFVAAFAGSGLGIRISRSVSAAIMFQGKGGEVVAKPTPTPKKTLPKKNTARTTRTNGSRSGNAAADEIAFWNSIKDSTNPADFNAYLKKYPNGEFAELAKNRLKTLEAAKPTATPAAETPTNRTSTRASSNIPRTRTNQTGIEFVLIPPGSFMMGSMTSEMGSTTTDEKPIHQVTINYSFYMGKYEVTQAQWQSVMRNNPSGHKDCTNCPVENVSWNDAQEFIEKLNQMNDGYLYRLPSEAEWEYACCAGMTPPVTFGKIVDGLIKTKPVPVSTSEANAFGLFDMHHSIEEWCQDWYHWGYDGAPTDGGAWLDGVNRKTA